MIPVDPNKLKFDKRSLVVNSFQDLRDSIKDVGQVKPIIISSTGTIIDGDNRVMAARDLGINVYCTNDRQTRSFVALLEFKDRYPKLDERVREYLAL